MKIAMDARGINWYKGTGIGTYTDKILRYMIQNNKDNFYQIYWSGENYQDFEDVNTKIVIASKKHHRFFEQQYFPSNLKKENVDIYHIPQNGIGISESIPCKKVVTIHDLIPYILPETVGRGYLSKFLREMPRILELCDGVITVSECSKRDVLKFFPIEEDKVFVTPLAADSKYKPLDKDKCQEILREAYNITKPFVLYIGGFSPRKNVSALMTAFSSIHKNLDEEHDLVIVGANKDDINILKQLSVDLNIESNVIFTGFVQEELLPVFYNSCNVFVYPSIYEGFGLPPLEAMSCGTPVITSDISSIPEVVGDGGILIDPFNMKSIMYSLEALLNDESIRIELSTKALKRASQFSWSKTSEQTIEAYKNILYGK
ncbi:glycosyltransferase family 1 protein [Clostridium sp. A1-XYC3]|uniref:Glycosyltransferase family 1 protein n=1 Tax=Clostridium tanneri TaxID=3037988 RepID=A0ABU4JR56_9CLOT|nr:glycosyltransferase family 1 protein [Clostridium sp. A1-XYC3]MDW8800617.1 glycosyltransferase family 1 protein [Clostridium sp. A1-XYC3]